jgi:hypothetical protein
LCLVFGDALLRDAHQQQFGPPVVARGYAALPLSERVPRENHETEPRHRDAERLKIGAHLAVCPPMAGIEEDRRSGCVELLRHIQVRRNKRPGKRFVDDLVNPIAGPLD